jgi:hypothetical protein
MLPAYPWETRPTPLTADEVCAALWEAEGHIGNCAARLKVGSHTLRKFISNSARCQLVEKECQLQLVDEAQKHLKAALGSGDDRRVDWAIRYVLNSANARHQGWGSADSEAVRAAQSTALPLLPPVIWADGTPIGPPARPPPAMIELARADPPSGRSGSGEPSTDRPGA